MTEGLRIDPTCLAAVRKKAMDRATRWGKGPRINDCIAFAPLDPRQEACVSFRGLSAYRTPDAVLFHRTTDIRRIGRSVLPSGLEVCVALGSQRAREILPRAQKQLVLSIIDGGKGCFAGHTLYFRYLGCLRALLDAPEHDAPKIIDVVHSSGLKKRLEVGVGRPRALYVLYPGPDGDILCRGAVMSYYEFVHSEPLTDEQWKALLDSDECPQRPAWLDSIRQH